MLQPIEEEIHLAEPLFNIEDLQGIDFALTPKHVAIIMDGNRRWAREKNLPVEYGHIKGAERLREVIQAAIELKIETLTIYSFSTENWKRSKEEISLLTNLYRQYLINGKDQMVTHGIRLFTIGDNTPFDDALQEALIETKKATEQGKNLNLVIALNYGARAELTRAVKKMIQDCQNKVIQHSDVSEQLISKYLDTAQFSDPDLLIRTSGEFRLSNFLLWQLAYTEMSILKDYWPDFGPRHLLGAIKNYLLRDRRCGS